MELQLLTARVFDAINISRSQGRFKAVGFLSEEEAAVATRIAMGEKAEFCLFGGYDDALRVMFIAMPDWAEDLVGFDIITPVTFTFRECDKPSHRSFLGTLMSLGITRETVGDILIENGRAVAFLSKDIARFVLEQITKVGGVGVTLKEGFEAPLPTSGELVQFSATVASTRLDSVVSAVIGTSREKAKSLILESLVLKNNIQQDKITATVSCGDKITVRGYGRFIVDECEQQTKKGRIILKYSKYT